MQLHGSVSFVVIVIVVVKLVVGFFPATFVSVGRRETVFLPLLLDFFPYLLKLQIMHHYRKTCVCRVQYFGHTANTLFAVCLPKNTR